jgi:hypothetical protein
VLPEKHLHVGPDAPRPQVPGRDWAVGYHRRAMADQTTSPPLEQQLQEIGAQLAWVRDYL